MNIGREISCGKCCYLNEDMHKASHLELIVAINTTKDFPDIFGVQVNLSHFPTNEGFSWSNRLRIWRRSSKRTINFTDFSLFLAFFLRLICWKNTLDHPLYKRMNDVVAEMEAFNIFFWLIFHPEIITEMCHFCLVQWRICYFI